MFMESMGEDVLAIPIDRFDDGIIDGLGIKGYGRTHKGKGLRTIIRTWAFLR